MIFYRKFTTYLTQNRRKQLPNTQTAANIQYEFLRGKGLKMELLPLHQNGCGKLTRSQIYVRTISLATANASYNASTNATKRLKVSFPTTYPPEKKRSERIGAQILNGYNSRTVRVFNNYGTSF